jgi:hypothetical protein
MNPPDPNNQPRPAEIAFNEEQCKYFYQLFDADEKEVRLLERSLLLASAAVYSFLASQITKADFELLWYLPALLTLIAGIRAAALGNRQKVWLRLLEGVERRWWTSTTPSHHEGNPGWASLYREKGSYAVTISAVLFYVTLLSMTILIGSVGAGINHRLVPQAR